MPFNDCAVCRRFNRAVLPELIDERTYFIIFEHFDPPLPQRRDLIKTKSNVIRTHCLRAHHCFCCLHALPVLH